ncbi:unnamed protein product [Miscanthus lutarioriparius]|uniref:Uncharacterized protein n=1 Tax=Miscanthus lutarioriparius TaxID=422564 RepID=A0A811MIG4_9POAL|nr:unnamed protein product [Miscanthus lutarioriparius]
METSDSEQPRVILKNSSLAATFSLELEATADTACLNNGDAAGTPSSSAHSKNSFTRSGLKSYVGLDYLLEAQRKRLQFLFATTRTQSNEPKKGMKNSSLGMTSQSRRARELTTRKRAIWGVDRPTRSRRATRRGAMFFTEARRSSGSAETTAAMSARQRPAPESRARIASGLEAELRRQ